MSAEDLGLSLSEVETYLAERAVDVDGGVDSGGSGGGAGPGSSAPVAAIAELFTELTGRLGADRLGSDRLRTDRLAADQLGTDGLGNVVVLALPSGTALLRYLFGALHGGAVPVAVPPAMPASRLVEVARRLGARLLVAPYGRAVPGTEVRRFGRTAVAALPGPWQYHDPGHVIILTSGTSGIFSGCLHRASSLFRNAARHAGAVGLRADDTMLVTLPLNFSYALVAQALAGLVTGARLVVTGPPFSQRGYLDAVRRHGVTSSSLTPFLLRNLVPGEPPRGLRMLTVGGDALPSEEVTALVQARSDLEVYITYGLTEAGPRVSTLAAHREPAHRHGSVGRPLPGVEMSLRDVRDGVGELLVTSDTVLVRRVGVADGRTRDTSTAPGQIVTDGRVPDRRTAPGQIVTDSRALDRRTAPGQIATGDLFRLDSDGYLYFAGRMGDSCVVDGVKVSLSSVRRLAMGLPGVVAATTRPCPGGRAGHAGDDGRGTYTGEHGHGTRAGDDGRGRYAGDGRRGRYAGDDEHVEHDGQRFVLELYMRDATDDAVRRVRAELYRFLLRAERPCRIRGIPAQEAVYK
ncbi:class I adenylate-forming enzyme family protein [Nonomuraea sp. NPDC049158]|uniref:class I adenylate-forming enzyme family protein n=1 Tax=Nonomuraea sp. NPDC049158 TaxID=3155649 RepID=UPI0033E64983